MGGEVEHERQEEKIQGVDGVMDPNVVNGSLEKEGGGNNGVEWRVGTVEDNKLRWANLWS